MIVIVLHSIWLIEERSFPVGAYCLISYRLGCFSVIQLHAGNNEDRDDSNQEELKNWLNVYKDVDGG